MPHRMHFRCIHATYSIIQSLIQLLINTVIRTVRIYAASKACGVCWNMNWKKKKMTNRTLKYLDAGEFNGN